MKYVYARATIAASLTVSCLVSAAASAQSQVFQRRAVAVPTAPTLPQTVQEETAAEQAAEGAATPPSDPAGVPPVGTPPEGTPPSDTPPAATPPNTAEPAPQPSGGSTPASSSRAARSRINASSATFAVLNPDAAMSAKYEQISGCVRRLSIAESTELSTSFSNIYGSMCREDRNDKSSTYYVLIYGKKDWLQTPASFGIPVANPEGYEVVGQQGMRLDHTSTPFFRMAGEVSYGRGWFWAILKSSDPGSSGRIVRAKRKPPLSPGAPQQAERRFPFNTWSNNIGTLQAKRISAGVTDGIAWAVGIDGRIYRQNSDATDWIEQSGCATAIANTGNDDVWVIGCDNPNSSGDRSAYHWINGTWKKDSALGVEVAVEADGTPWIIKNDGSIWRRK